MAKKSLTFDIFGRDKTASKTLNGIGRSANNMGSTFAKVGKVIAAAAAVAVVAWAKSSVDSLARIEKINAQTTAVLKSTGKAAKVSATHVEDLATALERKTATEAESIQEGANLLLTFKNIRNEAGKGNDIFDQTTSVMVDVARAMGTDSAGAAIKLGKALNDPVAGISALSRVGITFTDDQKDLIASLVEAGDMMGAQKVILGELQSQFGGSGAAFAETFAGKVDLIGHAWGEVGEAVFTKAMPMLSDLADWVLSDGIPALDGFFDGIEKNKDILGPAAIAVGGLTAAQWALNVAMAANPVGAVILVLGVLIAETALVVANFETLRDTGIDVFDKIGNAGFDAADTIVGAFNKVANAIVQPVVDGLNTIRNLLGMEPLTFNVDFGGVVDKSRKGFNDALDKVRLGVAGDIGLGQNTVIPGRGGGSGGSKVPPVTPGGRAKPGANFTQNIYPSVGMSESTIGSIAANGINRELRRG